MDGPDSKQITIILAGRPYPLKIVARKEAVLRKVVKDLNEKINRFQVQHPNRDKQDCLAMVLLALAIDLQIARKKTAPSTEDPVVFQRLKQIEDLLDQLLA